jgi:DegV family protein with EDD domain
MPPLRWNLGQLTMKIVIDSAGDLPLEWVETYDIHVIPINIHFGEQTFLQGVDISDQQFYRLAKESREFPKTSQPSPQQFVQFYRRIANPGDTILSLHVTGKLSGTYASAQMAARELSGEFNVIPIDSASGSAVMGFMAREARLLERNGATIEEIVHRMEWIAGNVQIILTLKTLEFARRSGRVKALQAALASLLNVKPLVILKKGELEVGERVRTRRRALEYVVKEMVNRLADREINAAVVHAEDLEAAEILLGLARSMLNCRELIVTKLSIGVAANLGPGTVGIAAYPVQER